MKDPREFQRHYIAANDDDVAAMLATLGLKQLDELFAHIPDALRFQEPPDLPKELDYEHLRETLAGIAEENTSCESFIGDGLPDYAVHPIVPWVSGLRNLTTAYTPYQPERSQGTLTAHWIYQCLMAQLTGFEAINTSLYDRSTALYEAIVAAIRLQPAADTAIVPEALYPGDMAVLDTLCADTAIQLVKIPLDADTGRMDLDAVQSAAQDVGPALAAIIFPQVNTLGLLEDVDALTDLSRTVGAKSIAVIDPMLLGQNGLKPPTAFGELGADFIVGEGQHLAIAPNFGGPGLGLFGVRYNKEVPNAVRATPGRYVGKAKDSSGRDCRVMVLSTREQHIRKAKATSNICSNQAFVATLVGAALLARGESGMRTANETAQRQAQAALARLTQLPGVEQAFPEAPFFNDVVLSLPIPIAEAIERGRQAGLHIGVAVSDRIAGRRELLKLSFSDKERDLDKLYACLADMLDGAPDRAPVEESSPVPEHFLRQGPVGLPEFPLDEIKDYYKALSELNVSPDQGCYPLGSCTMKYNPQVNDWAAQLDGFTAAHPQAPAEDTQGCLKVLYAIQEWFKSITGLAGVTTQPVAGAQGELVGLKLFQAWHRSRGDLNRDVILIPESAHGTNFATAAMAGFQGGKASNSSSATDDPGGIVLLKANERGQIDDEDFQEKLHRYGSRICGIMITNPNTSGLFETQFKTIADAVHSVGGLVYMDGANMNAIAGWVNLAAMGVDAVHNNLHKTWSIPHGGGGPGDAIVAVSEPLVDFLPGMQILKKGERYVAQRPINSIGTFHRHWGHFAHKVRCYAYLLRLGQDGVRRMSACAVLAARYLFKQFQATSPSLPRGAEAEPRMHEFILTLSEVDFKALEQAGMARHSAIPRLGKLFLDFGFHAPTVAWPETLGLMIEPTESYSKAELDRFVEAVQALFRLAREHPELLETTPHFTPIERIDEVAANRQLCLSEALTTLPPLNAERLAQRDLLKLSIDAIEEKLLRLKAPLEEAKAS